MGNNFATHAIGILVIIPTTLVAAFWSLLGVSVALSERPSGILVLFALLAGWFGIVTLWQLYHDFLGGEPHPNILVAWLGLACGCITSLVLIVTSGGSAMFRIVFFGWPLIAAAYFSFGLVRRPAP